MTTRLTTRNWAFQHAANLFEEIRCRLTGWIERNLIAEFPADEDLP